MTHRSRGTGAWLLAALVVAAATFFARSLPNVVPEGDMALLDLQEMNLVRHLEPVGSYSRYGWRHPGPLYAMVQLPIFWLSDYRHLSTSVTALLVNLVAVGVSLAVLLGRGGRGALAVGFAVMLTAFLARVPSLLANPWNPLVPVLLLPLLVALAAQALSGGVQALVAAVVVASLVAQAHIAFAAPSFIVVVIAMAGVALGAVRSGDAAARVAAQRAIIVAAAVAIGAWVLPVWDAIAPGGSRNLQAIWSFLQTAVPADPAVSAAAFSRFLVVPFTPILTMPGGDPVAPALASPWLGLAQVLLVAVSAIVFSRQRRHFEAWWAVLVLSMIGVAFLSARQLPERPLDHTLFWVSVLGVMSWTAIVGCLIHSMPVFRDALEDARRRRASRWIAAALLGAIAIVGVTQVNARAATAGTPLIRPLAQPIQAELARTRERAALLDVSMDNWSESAGLAALLVKQGYDVRVPATWSWMFGRSMAVDRDDLTAFRLGAPGDDVPAGYVPLAVVSTRPIFVQRR